MNRKNLTSAVVAGLAGVAGIAATAQAVNINPDGLGQVLIYPYYTTRNGNNTLLSVVNTQDEVKAVKVRFNEGKNTREVLDFNLYLSPYDVWTAALLDGGVVDTNCDIDGSVNDLAGNPLTGAGGGQCGVPHLLTTDASCTVPYLYEAASTGPGLQTFLPYRLGEDGGGTDIDRAAEGHFEMIEMGNVDEAGLGANAIHDDSGVPADCSALVAAWTRAGAGGTDGAWIMDPSTDIAAPTGGLFGGAAVINVAEGYMVSYDAKAINGFQSAAAPTALATLHAEPGTIQPGLNSGDVLDATVFLDDGSTLASSGLTRGVDAVSFVFMHDQLMNEYSTESAISGQTEWVITFPTKHFYVWEADSGSTTAIDPFTAAWDTTTGDACEPVLLTGIFDREENTPVEPAAPGQPPIVSPPPPAPPIDPFIPFELCYETNIIRFGSPLADGEATEIFGSGNFTNFDNESLGYENGWVNIDLLNYRADQNPVDGIPEEYQRAALGGLQGLPVTGFAAQKFGNLNAQAGIAAVYGGIYQHKGTRAASS